MKVDPEKVFQVVALIYKLFVKGRRVKLPGGGEFTFPQQKPGISDTVPRHTALGLMERRAVPERVEPPLSMQTLGVVMFIVFGLPIAAIALLAGWEWKTLVDDVPGNHITATLRLAFKKQPGAVFLAVAVWLAFLSAVGWGIAGHVFFQ